MTDKEAIKFLMDYIYVNIGLIYKLLEEIDNGEIEFNEANCSELDNRIRNLLPGITNRMVFLEIRKQFKIRGKYCLGGRKPK